MKNFLCSCCAVLSCFSAVAIAEPIVKNGEKIAFLGDSITQFGNAQDGGYVNLVIDGLACAGVKAIKIPAGVSGHKSDQMLARLDKDVVAKKPDWMLLSCGVNDVGHGANGIELEPYKKNITAILDRCAAAGIKVVILTPTLCNDGAGWKSNSKNIKLDGYCAFLREMAEARSLPLCDLNKAHRASLDSPDLPPEGLTFDNLHMNGYGNQMMAKEILRTLGVGENVIARAASGWRAWRKAMMPLANHPHVPKHLVTIDTWETLRRRAAEKKLPVEEYVMKKINDRAPDLDWRKHRLETQTLALAAPAKEGFYGRLAPLERITGENALGDGKARVWRASAWRNERVNGQLVLWTCEAREQVRVTPTALKGPHGEIPASAVSARFVRYTTGSFVRGGGCTHFVGDILDDARMVAMPSNSFRPVWLTVRVPAAVEPGIYRGSVRVAAAGGAALDFPMELEVLARTLPAPKEWAFFLDLWQHPWAVARYHGVEPFSPLHYELMKPLWEELAAAGQKTITTTITDRPWGHQNYDPYHSMVRHVKKADGTFRRDFSLWDEYVAFCEKCGLGPQIHCYTLATWGHIVYWENEATGDIESAALKPGSSEYETFWGKFLEDFCAHLRKQGHLGRVYIALDERPRDEMYATARLVEKYGKGLKLALAGNKKPSEFAGIRIDNYCQYIEHITPDFLDETCRTRKGGDFTTTFYVCCGPQRPNTFTDSPLSESLWVGLYAAATGLDGFLRWAYVNWPRDPLVDSTFGNWRPGDTFLVYPGCRTSSRWEMLRDGIETCEKIRILRAEGKVGATLETALAGIDFAKAQRQTKEDTSAAVAAVLEAVDAASR